MKQQPQFQAEENGLWRLRRSMQTLPNEVIKFHALRHVIVIFYFSQKLFLNIRMYIISGHCLRFTQLPSQEKVNKETSLSNNVHLTIYQIQLDLQKDLETNADTTHQRHWQHKTFNPSCMDNTMATINLQNFLNMNPNLHEHLCRMHEGK